MITLLHSAADFAHAKLSANQVECDYSQLTDVIAGCFGFETVSECADEGEEPLQLLISRLSAAQSIVLNASLGLARASQQASAAEVLSACMDGIEHVLNGASQSSSMRMYRSPEGFYAAQVAVDATKVIADDQKLATNIRERCAAGNQLEIGQPASWHFWSEETCFIEAEGVLASSDGGN